MNNLHRRRAMGRVSALPIAESPLKIVFVVCLLVLAYLFLLPLVTEAKSYHIIDLGTLGGTTSHALGVNEAGQVVGWSETEAGERRAFLWQDGNLMELGTLGGKESEARAINNAGQIVGVSRTSGRTSSTSFMFMNQHAFLWENGEMTDLGTLAGAVSSQATDVSESGLIVGDSDGRSFIWKDGSMTALDVLTGGSTCTAYGINESGMIVGDSDAMQGVVSVTHAALWGGSQSEDLGTLQAGWASCWDSHALAVNEPGQVVGYAKVSCYDQHAVTWVDGIVEDLGVLPGDTNSRAASINNHGEIVGWSWLVMSKTADACLWQNDEVVELNRLIPRESSWVLRQAHDINDRGQIVGYGYHDGLERAFLLIPHEDGTIANH